MNLADQNFKPGAGSCQSQQVYVIDDDVEVTRSLDYLLLSAGITSWPFSSAVDFLDKQPNLQPAPILLDVRMPLVNGIELMNILLDREIRWPIIAMTAQGSISVAVQAIKSGACDLLEKPFEFEALEAALDAAFVQLSTSQDTTNSQSCAKTLLLSLSPRELQVINLLMEGLPNKAVAHCLSISTRTVEMHRANAFAKLRVRSVAEVSRMSIDARPFCQKSA